MELRLLVTFEKVTSVLPDAPPLTARLSVPSGRWTAR